MTSRRFLLHKWLPKCKNWTEGGIPSYIHAYIRVLCKERDFSLDQKVLFIICCLWSLRQYCIIDVKNTQYFAYVFNEGIPLEPNIRCHLQVSLFCSPWGFNWNVLIRYQTTLYILSLCFVGREELVRLLIPGVSERQTTESSRYCWNWRFHLYMRVCHLVIDTYCDWNVCIFAYTTSIRKL